MNKHVLGGIVFSVIVGSIAIAYSLLFPAPEIPAPMSLQTEPRIEHCRRGLKNRSDLSFEILSSNLLVSEEKIVSKVLVHLAPGAELPRRIYVQARFTDAANIETAGLVKEEIVENPFEYSRERLVTLVTPANTVDENIYLNATVGVIDPSASRRIEPALTQTKAVLAIFGRSSAIRRDEALPYDIEIDPAVVVRPAPESRRPDQTAR